MSQNHPIALYKYKDLSGDGISHVEDMLRNHRLWYSSPLNFNDPFDCRCVFDIRNTREEIVFRKAAFLAKRNGTTLADALAQADGDIPTELQEVEQWQRQQIEGHSRRAANTGILCLTPVCDDFIMWTHYAKNHTGICIQFRVHNVSEEGHLDFIAAVQAVEYADRCPMINIVRDGTVDIVRKAFLTKSTPFRYEREWRIVLLDQGPGLKPIPKGIVGAVILGCQIDPAARERVVNACAKYEGDVEIVQATLDPETYALTMNLEKIV
jgi:hypothetical protein